MKKSSNFILLTWMAIKDNGATPKKVATKKRPAGMSMIGETILMNQLGRKGVIRRNNK